METLTEKQETKLNNFLDTVEWRDMDKAPCAKEYPNLPYFDLDCFGEEARKIAYDYVSEKGTFNCTHWLIFYTSGMNGILVKKTDLPRTYKTIAGKRESRQK